MLGPRWTSAVAPLVLIAAGCSQPKPAQKAATAPIGPNLNLYRYVIAGRAGAPPIGVQMTASPADDFDGRIAPDAKWFAYISRQAGSFELWLTRSNGSDPRVLSAFATGVQPASPAWSADAKWIVVADLKSPALYVLPSAGGAAKNVTIPVVCRDPFFSADGSAVFCIDGAQLCRVSIATGQFERLRSGVDRAALAEGPGEVLLFSNKSGLWTAPLAGGTPKQFSKLGGDGQWRLTRDAVLVFTEPRKLVRIDWKTAQESDVFAMPERLTSDSGTLAFDAARDETWYLLTLFDKQPPVPIEGAR